MPFRKALFLDRDGTLIRDTGYIRHPDAVELLPGVSAALAQFQLRGYLLVIVSNQSGIGRGLLTHSQYRAVHQRAESLLGAQGIHITASYYCPHTPADGCFCRKPNPGMLLLAAADLHVDLRQSIVIGDKVSDQEAGRSAACATILFQPPQNDWNLVSDMMWPEQRSRS